MSIFADSMLLGFRLPVPPNAQQFLSPGSYSWVVPDGVYFISAVAIGGGGGGGRSGITTKAGGGGGGGALGWVDLIPVTPGETLTIIVGSGGAVGAASSGSRGGTGGTSGVQRSSTFLLQVTGGIGGQYTVNSSGTGGSPGSGGDLVVAQGGTSGESGTGGQSEADFAPGGQCGDYISGLGGGLEGDGSNSSLGRGGTGADSGRTPTAGSNGGVRLVWGDGMGYPNNAVVP